MVVSEGKIIDPSLVQGFGLWKQFMLRARNAQIEEEKLRRIHAKLRLGFLILEGTKAGSKAQLVTFFNRWKIYNALSTQEKRNQFVR